MSAYFSSHAIVSNQQFTQACSFVTAALPIQSLFPFMYFMIRDLHIAKDEKDIGFYAGFVAKQQNRVVYVDIAIDKGASYMFGRALSSVIWGMVADKHGRKPVINYLQYSLWTKLKLLDGLNHKRLAGVIVWHARTYQEACRKEYNHMGLAIVSSSRSIGLIVGPAIGGYLAQPADKYPGIFSDKSIFGRFPYFLPCLSISLIAVIALVSCFWLPETLHKHAEDKVLDNIVTIEESLAGTFSQENGENYLQYSVWTKLKLLDGLNHKRLAGVSSSRSIGLIVGPAIGGYLAQETLHKHAEDKVLDNIVTIEESLAGTFSQENGEVGSGGCLQLFKNWPLMSAIILYSIFSLQDVAYAEVFSLWAISDRKYGGLSFSSSNVGNVLAISGLFLLFYQILVYPSVAKSVEPVTLVRTVTILTVPLLSSYAFMPALSGFTLQLVVNGASFLKNAFTVTTITVFNILMNDAVTQAVRAQANGIAVTLMSISKGIAPAGAGIMRPLGVLFAERLHSRRPGVHLQTVFCQTQQEALRHQSTLGCFLNKHEVFIQGGVGSFTNH
ncbi:hypothetical protein EJB05_32294, partial [Eragrostis curvula]